MEFENLYLTFPEYQELEGNLEEMPFNILSFKAQKIIDKHTSGRLKSLTEQAKEVKMCVFDLMKVLESYDTVIKNTGISSENTDGYSVSYGAISSENAKSMTADINNCIRSWLADCKLDDGTPYLYCGVE